MFPIILVYAIVLLIGGHHEPGGGFVAGLLVSAGLILLLLVDPAWKQHVLRFPAVAVLIVGLLFAIGTGALPLFWGASFLQHVHRPVSTTLVFDLGVCMTVIGAVLTIVQAIADAEGEDG